MRKWIIASGRDRVCVARERTRGSGELRDSVVLGADDHAAGTR